MACNLDYWSIENSLEKNHRARLNNDKHKKNYDSCVADNDLYMFSVVSAIRDVEYKLKLKEKEVNYKIDASINDHDCNNSRNFQVYKSDLWYRSPQQSRKHDFPENIKEVPSSWKKCKEKGITIDQIQHIKQSLKDKSDHVGNLDSLMISAESAYTTDQLIHEPNKRDIKGSDLFSLECETALRNLPTIGKHDNVFPEYTIKEFPKRCVKKTYTEPPIQWSFNPRHDTVAYVMSRKDILEEASSEDIEYLKAIMNKKSISKENDSFMKNSELAESKSWYRNENSFLQTNSEPNMVSTRPTSVAETEKEDDDLLSAFLSSKKKKKKHKHEKDSDQGMSDKKSKKKRKDKKKFKAEDLLQMLGDTELPWEDPEKLVQLNQVVSMGSHSRSENNEKNHHHRDKKQTQNTNAFDSDESMKKDFKQTSDASEGMYQDEGSRIKNSIKTLSPPESHQKYDKSSDERKSPNALDNKRSLGSKFYDKSREGSSTAGHYDKTKKTGITSGPRTPPTPHNKDTTHKRTGPRTPSPQPHRDSPERKHYDNFSHELNRNRYRYEFDNSDRRNRSDRQRSPFQSPRRNETNYLSNTKCQLQDETYRGRRLSPRYSRQDRYRRLSPSSPYGYPPRSSERRSPTFKYSRSRDRRRPSVSPNRHGYSSPYYKDHSSNSQFRSEYERDSDILVSMSGHGKLNSPKRLSLDERLERELGIKVEEMGRRKDAERRKRREQRMAERLQQTKSNHEMYDVIQGQEEEMEKSPVEYHETSQTQSDETNNSEQTINQTSDISKHIKEDMLNPQAYSTNSMTELSSIMSNAIENGGYDETQIAKGKKRAKNKSEVRYISLKPLDKREKRRQEKIQAMRRMVKKAVRNAGKGFTNEASLEEETVVGSEAEEFIPRSPVPLPDVSSCKPILVQLGFSLSKKEKKVLRYADGVLPGQGSPDHSEEATNAVVSSLSQSLTNTTSTIVKKHKKRKRIRLTIIEQISPSDNDDGVIPPPPPGSPPMFTMKEFLARYPISKPTLPMQMTTAVN